MNLCNDGHEEVCFDGRKCPVCEIIAEKDKKIASLEDQVKTLQDEIASAE